MILTNSIFKLPFFNGNNYVNKEFKLKKQIKVFIKLIKENFLIKILFIITLFLLFWGLIIGIKSI